MTARFDDQNHHPRCEARKSPRAACRCAGHDRLYRTPDDRLIAQTCGRIVLAIRRTTLTGYHVGELLNELTEASDSTKPNAIRALQAIAMYFELTEQQQPTVKNASPEKPNMRVMTLDDARAEAKYLWGEHGDALIREPFIYPGTDERAPTHLVGTRDNLPGLTIKGGGWSFEQAFEYAGVVL